MAFYVREKPIIRRIEYRGIRSISPSDLLSAFKNHKVRLSVESWFDQANLNRAAAVIRDLLAARGYESATVKTSYEQIPGANAVTITFDVDEGPKIFSNLKSGEGVEQIANFILEKGGLAKAAA